MISQYASENPYNITTTIDNQILLVLSFQIMNNQLQYAIFSVTISSKPQKPQRSTSKGGKLSLVGGFCWHPGKIMCFRIGIYFNMLENMGTYGDIASGNLTLKTAH